MKLVVKRNGEKVKFDKSKIEKAILKSMQYGSGIVKRDLAKQIADEIEQYAPSEAEISISSIETLVFHKLISNKEYETAKSYEGYRKTREYQREKNAVDNKILGIVSGGNKAVLEENSNKDATIHSTQRDLIAGEVSKDLARRTLFPTHLVQAHDEGLIHLHDLDYQIQSMTNCCLVNLKDMLNNGTVINGKKINTPKSFMTACTVATQIIQQVANGQFGGQSVTLSHLAPFVRVSYEKHLSKYINRGLDVETAKEYAKEDINKEIKDGIQTIQYQINTFSSSNGQAPFVTVFMYISEEDEYRKETAMLIEEMLKQRYEGMENDVGVPVTPSFPKLIYVLDEDNIHEDSEYRYLTDLAIKCSARRMYPDYISAKKMKENYEGNVFTPMGCRSFLAPYQKDNGEYQFYGRFNQGVVTINLPDVALSSGGDIDLFWNILSQRLELCFEALMVKHNLLLDTVASVSPIHWQHGAISRLEKDDTINDLLNSTYSTISLGYIGVYETVKYMMGEAHTTEKGERFALDVMNRLRETADRWKHETGLGFSLYGTPSESTTYKFAQAIRDRHGVIDSISDKDYIINSYHVDIKEEISPFDKLAFESQFQKISSGGSVSYVEVANLEKNLDALTPLINFMYENIQYAEINTKSDYCKECGFSGEILLDDDNEWYCPNCNNRDKGKMNVTRRTCGYLGDNFWNKGRTADIKNRVVHLDNKILE